MTYWNQEPKILGKPLIPALFSDPVCEYAGNPDPTKKLHNTLIFKVKIGILRGHLSRET